jgi:hypothetical protein
VGAVVVWLAIRVVCPIGQVKQCADVVAMR